MPSPAVLTVLQRDRGHWRDDGPGEDSLVLSVLDLVFCHGSFLNPDHT